MKHANTHSRKLKPTPIAPMMWGSSGGALDPSTGGGGASGGGGGEKGTVMFASGLRASIRGNSASGALDIAPAIGKHRPPPRRAA